MYSQTASVHRQTRTIRRRPNGLGGLGDYTLAVNVVGRLPSSGTMWGPLFTKFAAALGPVGMAVSIGYSVYSLARLFQAWHERGELKIKATAKAEDFVQSVWGTLQPNSAPTEDSVSKKIEDCKLNEAQSMITFLARQMYETGKNDQYFQRWVDQWGLETLRLIQRKLDAYLGYCQNTNEPVQPSPSAQCPSGFQLNGSRCEPIQCPYGFYLKGGICTPLSPSTLPPAIDSTGGYVPISSGLSGGSMFGILAALLAVIVISR